MGKKQATLIDVNSLIDDGGEVDVNSLIEEPVKQPQEQDFDIPVQQFDESVIKSSEPVPDIRLTDKLKKGITEKILSMPQADTRSNREIFTQTLAGKTGIDPKEVRSFVENVSKLKPSYFNAKTNFDQDPDNPQANYDLSNMMLQIGNDEEAKTGFSRIVNMEGVDPITYGKSLQALSSIERNRGNVEAAAVYDHMAHQSLPQEGDGNFMQQSDNSVRDVHGNLKGDPTQESQYMGDIASTMEAPVNTLMIPVVAGGESIVHGAKKLSEVNWIDIAASDKPLKEAATQSLKVVNGAASLGMGILHLLPGTSQAMAAFDYGLAGANKVAPKATEAILSLPSKAVNDYYKDKGQEVPELWQEGAATADLLWQIALFGGFHKGVEMVKGEAKPKLTEASVKEVIDNTDPKVMEAAIANVENTRKQFPQEEQYAQHVAQEIQQTQAEVTDQAQGIEKVNSPIENTPEPPRTLKQVKPETDVSYKGQEGKIDRKDTGEWYFEDAEGKKTMLNTEVDTEGKTPSLSDLGIEVTPDIPQETIMRVAAQNEHNGTVEYKGNEYFVSTGDAGDIVGRKAADGTIKDPFTHHKDEKFARDRKLAIINKFLEENGQPKTNKVRKLRGTEVPESKVEPTGETEPTPVPETTNQPDGQPVEAVQQAELPTGDMNMVDDTGIVKEEISQPEIPDNSSPINPEENGKEIETKAEENVLDTQESTPEPPAEKEPLDPQAGEGNVDEVKGITKEELNSEWKRIGIDEDFQDGLTQDFGTLAEKARNDIATGKVDVDKLAEEYADQPNKPVSDENIALLVTRKRQLQNLIEDLNKQREEATADGNEALVAEINSAASALQDRYETVLKGTNRATTTAGRTLRSVQLALEKDFSLANMRAQIANIKGRPLTEAEIKVIDDLHKDIAEKEKLLKDYEDQITAERTKNADLSEQLRLNKLKREANSEVKRNKRSATKENLKTERIDLFDKLKKLAKEQQSTLSANPINAKMVPVLTKLAKNYIKDGIVSVEEISANIFEELKDVIDDLTIDHVRSAVFGKRETPTLDRQQMALKAEAKKAQEKFNLLKRKYEQANRSRPEKIRDTLLKWQRFAILSGVKTLGKLTAAAFTRQALTGITEEAIGALWSKALPKIAKDAPREGGFNAKAEAANIAQAFKKATYKDIVQTAKTGKAELDVLFGKEQLPPEALDFFGHLHSALKVIPKKGEFYRSFEKRMQHAIESGADGTDPLVQMEVAAKAYEDAQRAIFMNENSVVSAYQGMLKILEAKGKPTGQSAATILRFLLPIVKIPANYASEAASYAAGGLRAARVLAKGIDTLTPEQKDYVLRNLKKQTLGATLIAIGYFQAENIGGYYQQGEKRNEKDVHQGNVKMFGVEIPHLFLHAPALEMLQIGATIKRVQDKMMGKGNSPADALATGAGKSIWGLIEQQPFVGEAARTTEDLKEKGVGMAAADVAQGFLVPRLIQEFAGGIDKPDLTLGSFVFDDPVKRTPHNFVEKLEIGIPKVRENVPIKQKEKKSPPSIPHVPTIKTPKLPGN